ncbi:MAG: tryptophan 2,3-dioxygenase [Rhodospirillales bacterium]|nr:tryptophan 2,3-dioxygenase [Rhodospirillales bacterium]MDE2200617.1 tryptophan 2,3-dioxygenase [Rhodospirillales bacterium]MDE2574755.1 tryptophan 2,3-dioxygenase [Rhodospirillales bacterium]
MTTRAEESMHQNIEAAETYGGYLDLDRLLGAQHPRSGEHDEMLFIVIHQASELWIKLLLHELAALRADIRAGQLAPSLKIFARIGRVQMQLIQSWDVLSTLTPHDYGRLRPYLGPSSGFQSHQYRLLEFLLGNKDAGLIEVHRSHPDRFALLGEALATPSLYDETLQLLARRGIAVPAERLARDWREPYRAHEGVEAAWLEVYRDVQTHWDLYDLAEKLVDVEDRFQQWRFRHLKTVARIIGMKGGTGGSSGVPFLARALDLSFFPELWSLRTKL